MTNETGGKWREWWIEVKSFSSNVLAAYAEKPDRITYKVAKDVIHVIEAQPILAELERVREENKKLKSDLANRVGQVHWKCIEIDKLEKENTALRAQYDAQHTELMTLVVEMADLQLKLAEAKSVIEFYGDASDMNHGIEFNEMPAYVNEDDFEPLTVQGHHFLAYGKRAREFLAKLEQKHE